MFDKLENGIPLHEAADFFVRLRTFEKTADENNIGSATYAPPDETGELEGQYAMPVEQVLAHMAKMVQNELKTQYAYMVFSNSLRDMAHHSIADEFEQHAHDETEHADFLLRRMSVMGGPVTVPDIPAPPAATDADTVVRTMIRMEQEGIQNWRTLRQMIGDENPMKFKVEEYLTKEQEHLDELWQVMPHETNPQILAAKAGQPMSAENAQPPPSAPDTNPSPGDQQKTGSVKKKEKDAEMPGMNDGAMGKHQPTPPPPALTGPSAGQSMGKMAEAMRAAFKKVAYYGSYGYDDPYYNHRDLAMDMHHARMEQAMQDKAEVEALQGRLRRAPDRSAIEKETLQDHIDSGRFSGAAVGGITGGALGGLAGHALGGVPGALLGGTVGAAGLGYLGHGAGKSLGESHGKQLIDRAYGGLVDLPVAAKPAEKMAEAFKRALDELASGSGGAMPGGTPPMDPQADPNAPVGAVPQPEMDPEAQAALQQEQQGLEAEHANEQMFYKQKFQQAAQALQQAQQASQAAQQQQQALQQQVDQGAQQQQQALAQAQQVEQAAMQNATAAHTAATQAMQQSLQAQKDSMTQAQLAVGMRDSVHAMRNSIMQMVQQELPPATPAEAGAIQGDMMAQQQGLMAPAPDPNAQQGAPGQDNTQQPAPDGNAAGQPAAAPDAGTPPNAAAPGGDGGAETSPNNASASSTSPAQTTAPNTQQGQAQEPPKVASAQDRFIGAITGAGVGGAAGFAESKMSNDPLRKKVQMLQGKEDAGDDGFLNAMNLAQAKMRLAVGEVSEKHPVASTAMGAFQGAIAGATLGPKIRHSFGG